MIILKNYEQFLITQVSTIFQNKSSLFYNHSQISV